MFPKYGPSSDMTIKEYIDTRDNLDRFQQQMHTASMAQAKPKRCAFVKIELHATPSLVPGPQTTEHSKILLHHVREKHVPDSLWMPVELRQEQPGRQCRG